MRKLVVGLMMVAAAQAVWAQCGDLPDIPVDECSMVYDFKASVKTTVSSSSSVKVECEDPYVACYRKPATIKLTGYFYSCDCCTLVPNLLFWFGKGWESQGETDTAYDVPAYFSILNVIGKKNGDIEGLFHFSDYYFGNGYGAPSPNGGIPLLGETFAFVAGGFGKVKDTVVQSLSGQIVGIVEPPACAASCEDDVPSIAYPACDFIASEEVPDVAAGTWSSKMNKSLSKAVLTANERYVLAGKLPKNIRYVYSEGYLMTVQDWVYGLIERTVD